MYVPKAYAVTDPELIARFVRENSFGLLVTTDEGVPSATHVPLIYDREENVVKGHLARANPQVNHFDGRPALCVFSGPHAYVSSLWYDSQPNVPTWNYVAVHVYGTVRAIPDVMKAADLLRETIGVYDQALAEKQPTAEDDAYFNRLLRGIVAFEIAIERIDAKAKLNQNKTEQDRWNVIDRLHSGDEASKQTADLMKTLTF